MNKLQLTQQASIFDNIELIEKVDKTIIKPLLDIDFGNNMFDENVSALLKKYYDGVKHKKIKVKYVRKKFGRAFAKGSLSLQNLKKPIRHTIASENYVDIDMKNCAPTTLLEILEDTEIECKQLKKYVKNRDTILKDLCYLNGFSKDVGKELFIILMVGGSIKKWVDNNKLERPPVLSSFVKKFQKEMNEIIDIVNHNNPEIVEFCKDKENVKSSVMSLFLQEWENRILEQTFTFFKEKKLIKNNIAVLCFDGIMLLNSPLIGEELLRELELCIYNKMGFRISFAIKPMNEIIEEEAKEVEGMELKGFPLLLNIMFEDSKKNDYKKSGGHIMKRSDTIPILYNSHKTYGQYLNELFRKGNVSEGIFWSFRSSDNLSKLIKYLESYDDDDLPFIKPDKNVFAFNNGFLDISDLHNLVFNDYEDYPKELITDKYFDGDFDETLLNKTADEIDTPFFDKIARYHLEDEEIYKCFTGMAGRLFYDTNVYDKFNCMLVIKGGANTGKSTLGNTIVKYFSKVATYGSRSEKTFGLETVYDKDLVYCPDIPRNISQTLDKSDLQRVIEGAILTIPRKNKDALNIKWKAPLFFIGNYYPEYKDSSGAIPRRLCPFLMNRFVKERDTTLENKINTLEYSSLLIKMLKSYQDLIKKYKNKTFEDWKIPYFKERYNEITDTCNNLYKFLELAPEEFEYWVIYEEGESIEEKDFKKLMERYYWKETETKEKYKPDITTLERCGYLRKKKSVCGNCNESPNGGKCCKKYNPKNRRQRFYIINMKLMGNYDVVLN
jgi:hypothetical protein